MPTQSCLLPLDGYSGLDLVPFISENHLDTIRYALENSLLTMNLCNYHLHCASDADDLFSLDFQLATGLWFTLKDISRTIQLAANPLLDPFGDLPGTLDPELLNRIGMPFPADTHAFTLSTESYDNCPFRHLYIKPKRRRPSMMSMMSMLSDVSPINTCVSCPITQGWSLVPHQFQGLVSCINPLNQCSTLISTVRNNRHINIDTIATE